MSKHRIELCAPSDWDLVLSPELAPLFVLDAAIVAAERFFAILVDPSSSTPGGTGHPPTRDLLDAMMSLRCHIHEHRATAAVFADDPGGHNDAADDDIPDEEAERRPF